MRNSTIATTAERRPGICETGSTAKGTRNPVQRLAARRKRNQ